MHHTNIIAMKDLFILEKTKKKKILLKDIVNTNELAEIAQILSLNDLAWKYK